MKVRSVPFVGWQVIDDDGNVLRTFKTMNGAYRWLWRQRDKVFAEIVTDERAEA